MLSERFYEMWGLTLEGGEERTYAINEDVAKLEAVARAAAACEAEGLETLVKRGIEDHYFPALWRDGGFKLKRNGQRLLDLLEALKEAEGLY